MSAAVLNRLRNVVQEDVGNRGLRTDPHENLISAWADDFAAACRSLAAAPHGCVAVMTGFPIPHAQPPCHETDGPLGAIFLARALQPLGSSVSLITDADQTRPLTEGLREAGLTDRAGVRVLGLPRRMPQRAECEEFWSRLRNGRHQAQLHLIALERVGPSHTLSSVRQPAGTLLNDVENFQREVPEAAWDRCYSMRGRDITEWIAPAHAWIEAATKDQVSTTIGIGDGGNEIGMGKIPWRVIRNNVPNGGRIACRVPTDYLLVAGISNWGAYALAAGVRLLRVAPWDRDLFDPEVERRILQAMVERGPLVDGVTGQQAVSVDGLPFEQYVRPLVQIGEILRTCC